MILSDKTITDLCENEGLISPFDKNHVQPASYDLMLADKIQVFENSLGDIRETRATGYWLKPNEFVLGCTVEQVSIPDNIAARFEGKSTLGRLGLATHITAGFIDPGFCGKITLEIKNNNRFPIMLDWHMRIGQICFMTMDDYARRPYGSEGLNSHYQGQQAAVPARF